MLAAPTCPFFLGALPPRDARPPPRTAARPWTLASVRAVAIYHASVKIISRSAGRSAVASIAYRAGECITNERDGITHDYTKRSGVEHTEILAPDTAPEWVSDRARLWNAVEAIEKRKDSQLAREIEVALPRELSREQQIALVRAFVGETCVAHGMVADVALHAPKAADGLDQPHAHILLTTRRLDRDGFGRKATEWNPEFGKTAGRAFVADTSPLRDLREAWGRHANQALERAGQEMRIDHRSLKAQRVEAVEIANDIGRPEPERLLAEGRAIDLEREPQPKLGVAAAAMERRGEASERGADRRGVLERNHEHQAERWGLRQQLAEVRDKLAELGRAAVEKVQDMFDGLDLSAARGAVSRAVWAGLRLDAGKAVLPVEDTPAAHYRRSLGRFEASAKEIEAFQRDGLVIPPSMVEAHRETHAQMRRDLHAWSKAEPERAWEAVKQFGQRRPQEGRELQIELGKELNRDQALMRRLVARAPSVGEEIARTIQPKRSLGMSR